MRKLRAIGAAFVVASAVMLCLAASPARAAFPERDITWIVPYAPGGGFDAWSRQIALTMQKYLPKGINVVVKNVTGAGGRTGSIGLYRSNPDGYTIGFAPTSAFTLAFHFTDIRPDLLEVTDA